MIGVVCELRLVIQHKTRNEHKRLEEAKKKCFSN